MAKKFSAGKRTAAATTHAGVSRKTPVSKNGTGLGGLVKRRSTYNGK